MNKPIPESIFNLDNKTLTQILSEPTLLDVLCGKDAKPLVEGDHAKVYRLNKTRLEQLDGIPDWIKQADLVRVELVPHEYSPDYELYHEEMFLTHLIAHTLFPKNFFKPLGAAIDFEIPEDLLQLIDPQYRKIFYQDINIKPYKWYLFTKEIKSDNHLTFVNHIRYNEMGLKVSICSCGACKSERALQLYWWNRQAQLVGQIAKAGIIPEHSDPTDWTVDIDGNIVFFEIKEIDLEKLTQYIEHGNEHNKTQLLKLVTRLREIIQSRTKKKKTMYDL